MHELSLARRLVAAAIDAAPPQSPGVERLTIEIGPTHIDPSSLEFNLVAALAGSEMETAVVDITINPDLHPQAARLVSITLVGD